MIALRSTRRLRALPFLLATLAVGALGCADDGQLKVHGEASVARAADAAERFSFPEDVALQTDDLAAAAEGVFGGHCILDPAGLTSIDVEVNRPRATAGMTTFRVQSGRGDVGAVRAVIDGQVYDGTTEAGACTISALYVEYQDELAAVSVDCAVTDVDGNAAQAIAELHFSGCTTVED